MKLSQYKFTQEELSQAKERIAKGSPYVENKFHPEDDAKTEREILAECAVIQENVTALEKELATR